MKIMTTQSWLHQAQAALSAAGIETARLDSLLLLEDCSGHDRGYLLAHPEYELTATNLEKLNLLLSRRSRHEPMSYIRGKSEFYGREFIIGPGVMTPRPESEAMIDLLKTLTVNKQAQAGERIKESLWQVADIGTGSGALGITAALELTNVAVQLFEIDAAAIVIASSNVINLATETAIVKSDLLSMSTTQHHILLCNLPYVPDAFSINEAAEYEPSVALFGGEDGLDVYRKLFKQIYNLPYRPLYILTEALPESHDNLRFIALDCGYQQIEISGFIQLFVFNI